MPPKNPNKVILKVPNKPKDASSNRNEEEQEDTGEGSSQIDATGEETPQIQPDMRYRRGIRGEVTPVVDAPTLDARVGTKKVSASARAKGTAPVAAEDDDLLRAFLPIGGPVIQEPGDMPRRVDREEESEDENVYENDDARRKGKKPRIPKKKANRKKNTSTSVEEEGEGKKERPKGTHVPTDDKFLVQDDEQDIGLPRDGGQVLIGYQQSWASVIYRMKDHKDAVRLLRNQSAAVWDINEELQPIQDLVRQSGLYPAVIHRQREYDMVTCSAMVERFHPEVYIFQFPKYEVGFTLDDPEKILGLAVNGVNPCAEYASKDWDQLKALALEVLGWDSSKTTFEFEASVAENQDRMKVKKGSKIKLAKLKAEFGGTKKRELKRQVDISKGVEPGPPVDPDHYKYHAGAYLLYTLGAVLFPDNTGNKVNAHFLQWLSPLEKTRKYAWGTATLAYLLDGLSVASRRHPVNLRGNFSLLQAFAYDHFKSLVPKSDDPTQMPIDPEWEEGMPTGGKWVFKKPREKGKVEKLIEVRKNMDNFDFEDVEFNPYNIVQEEGTEEVPSTSLATYYGPIWYSGGKLIYDPRRILRQMGIIQNVPRDEDNKYKLAPLGRSSNATQSTFGNWIPTFHPAPDYQTWTDRYDNLLPATVHAWDPALFDEGSYLKIVGNDEEQAEGYADWYAQQSHPLVINRAQ